VGLGLIPGYGGTQRLPHLVGKSRALELILTGRQVKADEALQIGLVNRVEKNPMLEAEGMMKKILSNGPLAIRNAMKAVFHSDNKRGFQVEADLFGTLCTTDDAKEGTAAFLEKRKAEFKGK
jgi:enoyl-CoA hydratase